MDDLEPVFLGYNVKELWDYIHPIAILGWMILCIFPKWHYTYAITLIPPVLHAILYSSILLPMMLFPSNKDGSDPPNVDINDIESVYHIFSIPNVFFCGWVHYLAFDLLVGRGIAMDAIYTCNVSYIIYYLVIVPCLLSTLYVGPVGYLLYMIIRIIILSPNSLLGNRSTIVKEIKIH